MYAIEYTPSKEQKAAFDAVSAWILEKVVSKYKTLEDWTPRMDYKPTYHTSRGCQCFTMTVAGVDCIPYSSFRKLADGKFSGMNITWLVYGEVNVADRLVSIKFSDTSCKGRSEPAREYPWEADDEDKLHPTVTPCLSKIPEGDRDTVYSLITACCNIQKLMPMIIFDYHTFRAGDKLIAHLWFEDIPRVPLPFLKYFESTAGKKMDECFVSFSKGLTTSDKDKKNKIDAYLVMDEKHAIHARRKRKSDGDAPITPAKKEKPERQL